MATILFFRRLSCTHTHFHSVICDVKCKTVRGMTKHGGWLYLYKNSWQQINVTWVRANNINRGPKTFFIQLNFVLLYFYIHSGVDKCCETTHTLKHIEKNINLVVNTWNEINFSKEQKMSNNKKRNFIKN